MCFYFKQSAAFMDVVDLAMKATNFKDERCRVIAYNLAMCVEFMVKGTLVEYYMYKNHIGSYRELKALNVPEQDMFFTSHSIKKNLEKMSKSRMKMTSLICE